VAQRPPERCAYVVGASVQGASEAGPESRVGEKREGLEAKGQWRCGQSPETRLTNMAASLKTPRHKEKTVLTEKKKFCLVGKEYNHVVDRSQAESSKSKRSKRMQSCREAEVAWLGEVAVGNRKKARARTRKEEQESKSKKTMREGRVGKPIFLRQHGENMK